MATTVCRRLVFVKTKRRRARPKPKTAVAVRPDGQLIVDAARSSAQHLARHAEKSPARRPWCWHVILLWFGGLATLAGTAAILIHLDGLQPKPEESVSVDRSAASYSSYGRSSTGHQAGPSAGPGNANRSRTSAEAFLAAPFPKRKTGQITCSVQVVRSDAAMSDFSKCLQQAGEK
jgi:hypothetical protein